jgi:hypothetical protein
MIQRYARKMHGRVFGEMVRNVLRASVLLTRVLRYSTKVSTGTSISLPLRSARPAGVVCVPPQRVLLHMTKVLPPDLFLIEPPQGAAHRPVKPGHIVVGGDSSGGGLTLAFLQVVRDSGLPPPAGGVLVSPWCDLHHSFPSIFLNADTVRS